MLKTHKFVDKAVAQRLVRAVYFRAYGSSKYAWVDQYLCKPDIFLRKDKE